MANAKEIRRKIQGIKKTKKITRAMEMVAASKMLKTQQALEKTRPYAHLIREVISHLAHANPEYKHPFTVERPQKRIGIIVVSSDRGLCGGLNTNSFKKAISVMQQWQQQNIEVDVCVVGQKAEKFFTRLGNNIAAQATHLGDNPELKDVIGIVKVMLDAYANSTLDGLYICSNEFVNTMTQAPRVEQLLPLPPTEDNALAHHWDYIYEPEAKLLLDVLLKRYIESQVYSTVIENIACEQAARMVAMKSATDNAGELIDGLHLVYHKARQASITQEINEIVAGAAAV